GPDRVAPADQRPDIGRPAQALGKDLRPTVEPDADPAPEERPAVARIDDRTATGGDHPAHLGRAIGRAEVRDRGALEGAERRLPVLFEDPRDGPAGTRFDPLVEVDERCAVAAGQPAA